MDAKRPLEILLLTNRDSDNVGDQIIEASDIGLIEAAMKNLNFSREEFKINSRAAGIITKKYVATKNPDLLKDAEETIKKCDVIVFGGAPLFNYRYQIFYERTATTLDLAKKYNKPVIFSSIGVESYDEDNEKCQRLKKTLNYDCVKQITTRDGIEYLKQYKENENLVIDTVSDPAVFCGTVLENFKTEKNPASKKKVGIFVLRANGFTDNKVNFTKDDAAALWVNIIEELKLKGYDYELLTSGHFGDEAYLDYLLREYDVEASKCAFNINSPEILIRKITSYDAVISCRLHPSIISFSLDVPSVGIVWNSKVKYFYHNIGYSDRIIEVPQTSAKEIVEKVEQIMKEGVKKDPDFLITVYNHLFSGLKHIFRPEDEHLTPYSYDELLVNIPRNKGTSPKEQDNKLKRKFRRTYEKYNLTVEKYNKSQKTVKQLKAEIKRLENTTALQKNLRFMKRNLKKLLKK